MSTAIFDFKRDYQALSFCIYYLEKAEAGARKLKLGEVAGKVTAAIEELTPRFNEMKALNDRLEVFPHEAEKLLKAEGRRLKDEKTEKALTDTERLEALFTLFGGGFAVPTWAKIGDLFKDGRAGIDRLVEDNPTLIGREATPENERKLAV